MDSNDSPAYTVSGTDSDNVLARNFEFNRKLTVAISPRGFREGDEDYRDGDIGQLSIIATCSTFKQRGVLNMRFDMHDGAGTKVYYLGGPYADVAELRANFEKLYFEIGSAVLNERGLRFRQPTDDLYNLEFMLEEEK